MKKPEPKTSTAPNVAAAAKMLGVTRQTLTHWRKDGCPGFNPNGTVDIAEVETWKALTGKDAGKVPAELSAARIRLLNAQAQRVERENRIRDGLAVDLTEVRSDASAFGSFLFTELERIFTNDLPASCKGMDEYGIRTASKKAIDELRNSLKQKLSAMQKEEQK